MAILPLSDIKAIFGDIDVYLFDQLLKGRIKEGMTLLDAGCGNGRNIQYLMQAGIKVYGADASEEAIRQVHLLVSEKGQNQSENNFIVSDLESLTYSSNFFDVVICSAVLHFAKSETHFKSIVKELMRVLKPGGMFFCRLSTTIGMEGKLNQLGTRNYLMPHGPVWFLAAETLLLQMENELQLTRLEPLKSTLVEWERSMTTWVLRK